MKVAVVGAGAFGCAAALTLGGEGHEVTLFERSDALLRGASYNNQNRLHLGYHYPRDDETARQCQRGFACFTEAFPECVRGAFPNGYFIAEKGSRTSPEDFVWFCARHALPCEPIDPESFHPRVQNVSLGVLTRESVYDAARLRSAFAERLMRSRVRLRLGCPVARIARVAHGFELGLGDGAREGVDAVVNCAYASQSALSAQLGHRAQPRVYEYTAVAVVALDDPSPVGITVLDGPFVTLLPFGASQKHLLYHVERVVIAREEAAHLDPRWLDPATSPFAGVDVPAWFESVASGAAEFVPSLARARLVGVLQGPRMVLARSDDTDARPSIVTAHEPGYVSVFAGKIDHCLWAADDVAARLA